MATNTLIQKLDVAADGFGASTSNRQQVETFLVRVTAPGGGGSVTVSIAAGDWVEFDTDQSGADRVLCVKEAVGVATHGNGRTFGVALESVSVTAPDGETNSAPIRVVVGGYVARASVGGTTAKDNLLVGPIGTAGMAEPFNAGTTESRIVGQALEADTANFAAVWVIKSF